MLTLPTTSYLPINHCNLPTKILGSLTFQQHPVTLLLDGVRELHHHFFNHLDSLHTLEQRAKAFTDYMQLHFLLNENVQRNSLIITKNKSDRINASYLSLLQGWMFESNNRDGAIIKGWVESRFGLMPRWHKQAIKSVEDSSYNTFMHERTTGVYNTNSIEAQLDLLYSFCQYELHLQPSDTKHINLFRGTDLIHEYDVIDNSNKKQPILLMNNMSSLTSSLERADEFGSTLYSVTTPIQKIFYFSGLLPGKLQGESEYLVIGGLYQINIL